MSQSTEEAGTTIDAEIIPPELAVRAMRDSGYRNTDYALAELIDNSVQASATQVDVICLEVMKQVNQRKSRRIEQIAVLDNGEGMTPQTLRIALQFGNGTHLKDRKGIGRFGMGLPNSSISQCRRLEVWSWQAGPKNAMWTYLDVDEIEAGGLKAVPQPIGKPVPIEWLERSELFGTSGTLVLWSNFDDHRLQWRGAKATLENTENLIGRMYRKFIDAGDLTIRLAAYKEGEITFDAPTRVNDPLYLTPDSSTPSPFDKEAMFQTWGDGDQEFSIHMDGEEHIVSVRITWAKEDTIKRGSSADRGSTNYGKHAAKNVGVSVVRERRELELDRAWTIGYDPRERWWGVEVEFPSALDEIFGVTNNKQHANTFASMAQFDWEEEADPGEQKSAFRERMLANGDPRGLLIDVSEYIQEQLEEVRRRIKGQTKGKRSSQKRHDDPDVEDQASDKFRERAEGGHEAPSDDAGFSDDDKENLQDDLVENDHYSSEDAKNIVDAVVNRKRKVQFSTGHLDGHHFFSTKQFGDLTKITFNTNHPIYDQLLEALDPDTEDDTDADLLDRVHRASDTLKLLFAAWARYELEETQKHDDLMDMRQEWGKMTKVFLREEDEGKS
ncbi:MAG: ATP-binding protein [Thalassovita sp.]